MKQNSINKKYRQLNNFIRDSMQDRKISQKDIAEWLNLSQGCISQKLRGKVEWTAREIISVFELLEIENEWNCKKKKLDSAKAELPKSRIL